MRYPSILILTALLAGCGAGTAPPAATPVPAAVQDKPASPAVKVVPHERWADAVLYFVITDRFGKEARTRWMTEMGHSATLEEATLNAFNITFDELNTLWRASLAVAPDPGT